MSEETNSKNNGVSFKDSMGSSHVLDVVGYAILLNIGVGAAISAYGVSHVYLGYWGYFVTWGFYTMLISPWPMFWLLAGLKK